VAYSFALACACVASPSGPPPTPSTTWQGPLPTTPSGRHPKNSKLARFKLLKTKNNLSIESGEPGSIFYCELRVNLINSKFATLLFVVRFIG